MKVRNSKAYHDYQILERLEAGIMLTGGEAKSVREGRAQLGQAYVRIRNSELWLVNGQIPKYRFAAKDDTDEARTRKLLATRDQIRNWEQKVQTKGVTIVPLNLFTKKNLVKVELGLVKGKKEYEKRETIKKRDIQRDIQRAIRGKGQ